MIKVFVTGKTYDIRNALKMQGFRWNATAKAWIKAFNDSEKQDVDDLKHKWVGVEVRAKQVDGNAKEKRYFVKESWIFNLESMHDKCFVLIEDIREGNIKVPFVVAGKTINSEDDLYDLENEAGMLCSKAWRGVTGKEYGRIKEIVTWRVEQRYATCMASGMSESDAGKCFEDI